MIVVILLGILMLLSLVAACLVFGVLGTTRAFRSSEKRWRNAMLGVLGLAIAGFLTYPFVLGPAVAAVACSSGVGPDLHKQVDLSGNGYEINWPPETVRIESGSIRFIETPEGKLFRHGVDDVISKHVAFIETASFEHGGFHRISLGPESSPHCVEMPPEFAQSFALPPGTCLQVEPVGERDSKYVLEASPSFGKHDAFERSVKFVERASGEVLGSYTVRRIPSASFELEGEGARYCPTDALISDRLYALPELVRDHFANR
jgi:hypothetical protein